MTALRVWREISKDWSRLMRSCRARMTRWKYNWQPETNSCASAETRSEDWRMQFGWRRTSTWTWKSISSESEWRAKSWKKTRITKSTGWSTCWRTNRKRCQSTRTNCEDWNRNSGPASSSMRPWWASSTSTGEKSQTDQGKWSEKPNQTTRTSSWRWWRRCSTTWNKKPPTRTEPQLIWYPRWWPSSTRRTSEKEKGREKGKNENEKWKSKTRGEKSTSSLKQTRMPTDFCKSCSTCATKCPLSKSKKTPTDQRLSSTWQRAWPTTSLASASWRKYFMS